MEETATEPPMLSISRGDIAITLERLGDQPVMALVYATVPAASLLLQRFPEHWAESTKASRAGKTGKDITLKLSDKEVMDLVTELLRPEPKRKKPRR